MKTAKPPIPIQPNTKRSLEKAIIPMTREKKLINPKRKDISFYPKLLYDCFDFFLISEYFMASNVVDDQNM